MHHGIWSGLEQGGRHPLGSTRRYTVYAASSSFDTYLRHDVGIPNYGSLGPPPTRMVTRASGLWRVLRIDRRYSFHRYNRGSWCLQRLPNTIRRDQQHLPVYRFHVLCRNKIGPSKGFTMARLETDKKLFRLSEANEVNTWLFSHHGLCTILWGMTGRGKWYGERTKRYPSRLGSQTTLQ